MRRARARTRRALAWVAMVAPAVCFAALDVVHRARVYPAMLRVDAAALVTTWAASAAIWMLAVVGAARRRGATRWIARALLVALVALATVQSAVFVWFGTYVDRNVLRAASGLEGAFALARPFLPRLAAWWAFGSALALGCAAAVSRLAPPRRSVARNASLGAVALAGLTIAAAPFLPHRPLDAAPDAIALGAIGRLAVEGPARAAQDTVAVGKAPIAFTRAPATLASATPRHPRDVVFVLTESVRASAVCSARGADCPRNPFSNDAAPNRIALERMRAVDSFTLLSFGVIFSGLPVNAPKSAWLTAPLLFDYAHAGGVTTAYWSAQHPAFASSHAWTDHAPINRLAWATDFDAHADEVLGADDAATVQRAIAELPTLREPFFAVVHFAGTHFPYRIDANDVPFQPESSTLDPGNPAPLRNRYFDAIYRQDKLTAELVRAIRSTDVGRRAVIVFTSDHGESFYEHEAALHGSSLWDEELRVPFWIDAPEGALDDRELASLRALRDAPVTHVDVAPTILDLLGLFDEPAWSAARAKMPGASLLRSPARDRPTFIATCNDLWSCFIPVWGKLIGDRKWLSHPLSPTPQCFDTRTDPGEKNDLGAAACGQ